MDLSLFDYPFPKELVAQHPLPGREDSRLMVIHREDGTWEHRRFPDLLEYLRRGDLIVLNNAEADLVTVGDRLVPPLPPYIKRKRAGDFTEEDFRRYRTVYAAVPGSKAAPTAGFHFSEGMLKKAEEAGAEIRFLTLHVSYDTYKPIRTAQIEEHTIHGETYEIPPETAAAVLRAKKDGRRVVAVGTTTVRALESWSGEGSPIMATTTRFITPGYHFKIADLLLTNFHRPRSTVLVLVSALAGRELVLRAYQEAIQKKYRLFSYGDAMLIV